MESKRHITKRGKLSLELMHLSWRITELEILFIQFYPLFRKGLSPFILHPRNLINHQSYTFDQTLKILITTATQTTQFNVLKRDRIERLHLIFNAFTLWIWKWIYLKNWGKWLKNMNKWRENCQNGCVIDCDSQLN